MFEIKCRPEIRSVIIEMFVFIYIIYIFEEIQLSALYSLLLH